MAGVVNVKLRVGKKVRMVCFQEGKFDDPVASFHRLEERVPEDIQSYRILNGTEEVDPTNFVTLLSSSLAKGVKKVALTVEETAAPKTFAVPEEHKRPPGGDFAPNYPIEETTFPASTFPVGPQPKFKVCLFCGQRPNGTAPDPRFCSEACQRESSRGTARKIVTKSRSDEGFCHHCGMPCEQKRFCGRKCEQDEQQWEVGLAESAQPVTSGDNVTTPSSRVDTSLCRNCKRTRVHPGFDFCGKTCGLEYKRKHPSSSFFDRWRLW